MIQSHKGSNSDTTSQINAPKFFEFGVTCDTVSQCVQQIMEKCFAGFKSGVTCDTGSQIVTQNLQILV